MHVNVVTVVVESGVSCAADAAVASSCACCDHPLAAAAADRATPWRIIKFGSLILWI